MSHTISPSLWTDELFLPVLVQKVIQSDSPDFVWQNINLVSITMGEIRKLFFDFSDAPGITGKTIVSTEVYFSPADIPVGNVVVEENFQVLVLVDTTVDNSILSGEQYNLYCYVTLDDGEIINIIGQVIFNDSSLTLQPPTGTNFVIDVFSEDESINVDPHTGHVNVEINTDHSNNWTAAQDFSRIFVGTLDVTNSTVINGTLEINTTTPGQNGYVLTFENSVADWRPAASGGVSSVTNSNGTLTISPNVGAVIASLNLSHANTWLVNQVFSGSSSDTIVLIQSTVNAKDAIEALNRHAQANARSGTRLQTNATTDWFYGMLNAGGGDGRGSDLVFVHDNTNPVAGDGDFIMFKSGDFKIVNGKLEQPTGAVDGYIMTASGGNGTATWQPNGSVTSVTAFDNSVVISPNSGNVLVRVNDLATITWTNIQHFNNITVHGGLAESFSPTMTWNGIDFVNSTLTIGGSSGTVTAPQNLFHIAQPFIASVGTFTVNDAATVYIEDAVTPDPLHPVTIVNAYAVWVAGGTVRLDGGVRITTGAITGYFWHCDDSSGNGSWQPVGSSGGTVTEVDTDSTLTGGPITTTGTLGIDLTNPNSWTGLQTFGNHISIGGATLNVSSLATNDFLKYNGSNWINAQGNAGTVTSVVAGTGLSGGTITSTGTISLDTSHVNSYTGQQFFAQQTLTDASTISWNANTQQAAFLTLTGSHTLALPTNLQAGATYTLIITQDGSGGHTLAYASGYKWSNGATPVLSTAANAVDILTFLSDGTSLYGAFAPNFS